MAAAPIDELWNRGLARGRSSYRGRVARWKTKRWHIAQCAVAAAVAWLVASELLGHSVPVFAPIAAVVSLGDSSGAEDDGRRSVHERRRTRGQQIRRRRVERAQPTCITHGAPLSEKSARNAVRVRAL